MLGIDYIKESIFINAKGAFSMTDPVLINLDQGVLTVTFNRPEKKNAMTNGIYDQINEAIYRAEHEAQIKVVVLTGAGDFFSAGNDIADFMTQPPEGETSPVVKLLLRLANTDIPILAAVNGPAIGIGTTILLHCDKVYAVDSAFFSTPFVTLGVVPEAGSSLLMPKYLGYQMAARLLMFAERITAEEAKDCGLIGHLCAADQLTEVVAEEARRIAKLPKKTIRQAKRLMRRNEETLTDRIVYEMEQFGEALRSAESKEAMAAFVEKRSPNFAQFDIEA